MVLRTPKRITRAYLEHAALAYLERFSSSAENLRRVLMRKVERSCRHHDEDPSAFAGLVGEVVERCARNGLVDDRRYAEGRIASLRRRGGSTRAIAARLGRKGVERDVIEAALAAEGTDDEAAAQAFARRRRLGPYRTGDRAAYREKDLAALARAGFAYATARAVVDGTAED
jgi:regulatory protein